MKKTNTTETREVAVNEMLAEAKGKRYVVQASDLKGCQSVMNGEDIPKSFRLDTIEKIWNNGKGGFALNYGELCPTYRFCEI